MRLPSMIRVHRVGGERSLLHPDMIFAVSPERSVKKGEEHHRILAITMAHNVTWRIWGTEEWLLQTMNQARGIATHIAGETDAPGPPEPLPAPEK